MENILNLGISPAKLVEIMKERFVSSGGAIFEGKSLSSISVHDDFAVLNLSDGGSLPCRLVIDAMGNFSPIVRQISHFKIQLFCPYPRSGQAENQMEYALLLVLVLVDLTEIQQVTLFSVAHP